MNLLACAYCRTTLEMYGRRQRTMTHGNIVRPQRKITCAPNNCHEVETKKKKEYSCFVIVVIATEKWHHRKTETKKKHLRFTNNGNDVFENCIFIVRCVGEYCLLSGRPFWISLSICVHFYIVWAHQLCQRPSQYWRRRRRRGHRCHWFSWMRWMRCPWRSPYLCAFQFKLASHRYYVKVFYFIFSLFLSGQV